VHFQTRPTPSNGMGEGKKIARAAYNNGEPEAADAASSHANSGGGGLSLSRNRRGSQILFTEGGCAFLTSIVKLFTFL